MNTPENEDSSCIDFENIVINRDEMEAYLKKLKDDCTNIHVKIDRKISESITKNSECIKQLQESKETITQLSVEKKELKANLDNTKLEQKVVEKKAINTMKEIEKIKADIESIKEKKETLSLQIVDTQQELEKSKEYMKKQWNSLKKACRMYKNILDIHIDTEMINHVEHVTVKFFCVENPTDKKFFVVLMFEGNCWKVKKIEPELSMENKYQLNRIVQFAKQSEVANVTSLLCELRNLFLKNYFHN